MVSVIRTGLPCHAFGFWCRNLRFLLKEARLPSRFARRCLCCHAATDAQQGTSKEIKLASFFSHLRALILFVRLPTCTKNTLSLRSPIRSNNSLSAYQA